MRWTQTIARWLLRNPGLVTDLSRAHPGSTAAREIPNWAGGLITLPNFNKCAEGSAHNLLRLPAFTANQGQRFQISEALQPVSFKVILQFYTAGSKFRGAAVRFLFPQPAVADYAPATNFCMMKQRFRKSILVPGSRVGSALR